MLLFCSSLIGIKTCKWNAICIIHIFIYNELWNRVIRWTCFSRMFEIIYSHLYRNMGTVRWNQRRPPKSSQGTRKKKTVAKVVPILLMQDIPNNHLGYVKQCKWWDRLQINWCRTSSINSRTGVIKLPILVGSNNANLWSAIEGLPL